MTSSISAQVCVQVCVLQKQPPVVTLTDLSCRWRSAGITGSSPSLRIKPTELARLPHTPSVRFHGAAAAAAEPNRAELLRVTCARTAVGPVTQGGVAPATSAHRGGDRGSPVRLRWRRRKRRRSWLISELSWKFLRNNSESGSGCCGFFRPPGLLSGRMSRDSPARGAAPPGLSGWKLAVVLLVVQGKTCLPTEPVPAPQGCPLLQVSVLCPLLDNFVLLSLQQLCAQVAETRGVAPLISPVLF